MTEANPEILNVMIQECGRYELKGQKATLEIHHGMHTTRAILNHKYGRSLNEHVLSIGRDRSKLEIQGMGMVWLLAVDAPIRTLGLSTRANNCLRFAGVITVCDLLGMKRETLTQLPNLGPITAKEIEESLESIGLAMTSGEGSYTEWMKRMRDVALRHEALLEDLVRASYNDPEAVLACRHAVDNDFVPHSPIGGSVRYFAMCKRCECWPCRCDRLNDPRR